MRYSFIILIYFVAMNILGIYFMYLDKKKARHKKWRTKESTFFLLALLGGSLGILLGMRKYRHKTKHLSFTIGIPCIIILQLIVIGFVLYDF